MITREMIDARNIMVKEANLAIHVLRTYNFQDGLVDDTFKVFGITYKMKEFSNETSSAAGWSIATVTGEQDVTFLKFTFELDFDHLRSMWHQLRTTCNEHEIKLPTQVDLSRIWDLEDYNE